MTPIPGGWYYATGMPGLFPDTVGVNDQYKNDLREAGLEDIDVQVRACAHAIDLVNRVILGNTTEQPRLVVFGGSLGAGVAYNTAYAFRYQDGAGARPITKGCVALYGGTDYFAEWSMRQYRRYIGSIYPNVGEGAPTADQKRVWAELWRDLPMQLEKLKDDPSSVLPNDYMQHKYDIGFPNMAERGRLMEEGFTLLGGSDREAFTESLQNIYMGLSIANWFLYSEFRTNPENLYPFRVHHGTADDIVSVRASQWFANQMYAKGRSPSGTDPWHGFMYFEAPGAGHDIGQMVGRSLTREFIADQLVPQP